MPQAQLFAGVLLVVHRDRERQVALHAVEHGDATGKHLNGTGRKLVVEGFGGSRPNLADHLQHGFAAQMLRHREGFSSQVGIHRDLNSAAAIAQIDENHSAVVAATIHPAAQLHLLIDVLLAQVSATVAAHGMSQLVAGEFPTALGRVMGVCRRGVAPRLPVVICRGSPHSAQSQAWSGSAARRPGRCLPRASATRCRW